MKRLGLVLVSLMAVAGFIGLAYGGSTDSMNIKVTLVSNIEVDITQTEYNFGILSAKQTSVSGSYATVTNTSQDNREDWALKLTNPANWTTAADVTPGSEQFLLMAQFGTSAPASWTSATHSLTTTDRNCSVTTYFGNATYSEGGLDVIPNATRNLWFRITMPDYSAYPGTEQTIPVTVTASAG
jgi:hypothetical protein